jgi:hypothetical protein
MMAHSTVPAPISNNADDDFMSHDGSVEIEGTTRK